MALFVVQGAWAYPTGITGYSGNPSTCNSCHFGGSYTGNASVSGTGTVDRGSTTSYTINLSSSGAVDAGFNLSASGGTLNDTDANAYKSSGELTHSSPESLSGNAASWSFSWTAPAGSSGDYTFYFCINQVNGNRDGDLTLDGNGEDGDNPACSTRTITVDNDPTVTNPVANFSVNEDAANDTFSLTNIFSDTEDADSALTYAVIGNTNSSLVTASVDNSTDVLTLDYLADQNGSATITVRATDSEGQTVSDAFTVTVNAVNDVPVFTKGVDQTVNEDAGAQSVSNWATSISEGATNESAQTLTFNVSNDNNALFSAQPAISSTGTLTYTPAGDANGSATVTVNLSDDGGTTNGGNDTSGDQTFTITVNAVNDDPVIDSAAPSSSATEGASYTHTFTADDPDDTVTWSLSNAPTGMSLTDNLDNTADLSWTPDNSQGGNTYNNITVQASDGGGTPDSEVWSITVSATNDSPTVTNAVADFTVDEDAADDTFDLTSVFSDIDDNDADLTFAVDSNSNSSLVSASANNTTDVLTLDYQADQNGSATIKISATDSGGLSATDEFVVTVTALNDAPTITLGADQTVDEDAGAQTVSSFATGFDPGPTDESGQSISDFNVSNDNNALFSTQPDIDNSGTSPTRRQPMRTAPPR